MKIYRKRATAFLKRNPWCAVLPGRRATEVHHVYGRGQGGIGKLLLWEPGWLAVSSLAHAAIHRAPAEAQRLGLIGPKGTWNDYQKAVKLVTGNGGNLKNDE